MGPCVEKGWKLFDQKWIHIFGQPVNRHVPYIVLPITRSCLFAGPRKQLVGMTCSCWRWGVVKFAKNRENRLMNFLNSLIYLTDQHIYQIFEKKLSNDAYGIQCRAYKMLIANPFCCWRQNKCSTWSCVQYTLNPLRRYESCMSSQGLSPTTVYHVGRH